MTRSVALSLVAMCSLLAGVSPGQDEVVLGKKAPEWLTLLKEAKEVRFRRAALIALEVFGPKVPGVIPGLLEALEKEPEPEIRRDVAQLLGRMGADAKGAVEALGVALKNDKSALVREAAARSLGGKLGPHAHSQVQVLAAALQDPHPGTRVAAVETLKDFGDNARPVLAQLLAILKDNKSDRFTRIYAANIVARFKEDATTSVPVLMATVGDPEALAAVREAAADALGRLGPDAAEAVGLLARVLKDKEASVRRAAAVALGQLGEKSLAAWPAVKEALTDSDKAVRHQAIRLAGSFGGQEKSVVAPLAQAALSDEHTENRLAAIQELGELGPIAAPARPILAKIAHGDVRPTVREAAANALKRVK